MAKAEGRRQNFATQFYHLDSGTNVLPIANNDDDEWWICPKF